MKPRTIHLHIPQSWNQVPIRDLERIHRFGIERDILHDTLGHLAEEQFKVKVFLALVGLRLKGKCLYTTDGKEYFIHRRRSWWPWSEEVPLTSERIYGFIKDGLKWIEDPFNRLVAPYDFIIVLGKKFKGPTTKMTSLTYQQYTMAQNLLSAYWTTQENILFLLKNRPNQKKTIKENTKLLQRLRCKFLACLFCPGCIETEILKEGRKRKIRRYTYEFDPSQIERHYRRFRFVANRIFPVMLQFFLSVQKYFSTIYPDLFVKSEEGERKQRPDFLVQEVETMSAIMKYQGFADYQTIYDSNSVHILKVLDNMAKDAREIKAQRAKLKK